METKYDYFSHVVQDIECYLAEREILVVGPNAISRDELYDDLFQTDSVTGNASGSYTFSTWKAAENVCHNENLLDSALHEFYGSEVPVNVVTSPELCDVLIRCYLLSSCLDAVIDEIRDDVEDYFVNHNMEE